MKVINKTRRKTIAESAKICPSPLSKAKGLMFSKPLKDKALVFVFKKPKQVVLHTLFVFFPIDIMFLDKKQRVVETIGDVKPFTPLIRSRESVNFVIELPNGTIKRTKTRVKDLIQF